MKILHSNDFTLYMKVPLEKCGGQPRSIYIDYIAETQIIDRHLPQGEASGLNLTSPFNFQLYLFSQTNKLVHEVHK